MLYLPKGQEIIIWGCGVEGTKIIKNYAQYYRIRSLMDRKIKVGETGKYMGYTVYNPNDILNKLSSDVVVVVAMYHWEEPAKKLEAAGMRLMESYIVLPQFEYTFLNLSCLQLLPEELTISLYIKRFAQGKKLVAAYGFCHMYRYKCVLESSRQFLNEYIFIGFPALNSTADECHKLLRCREIWNQCDVLLYSLNPFIKEYDVPAPKEVLSFLKPECRIISITSAAFKGYFPQHKDLDSRMKRTALRIGWGDKNIERMLKEGETVENIIKRILADDFMEKDKVEAFFKHSLMMLREEEKHCDVKIADYIEDNYKSELLHYSYSHPIAKVLLEVAKRVCKQLNIADVDMDVYYEDDFFRMDSNEELVYPSVCQVLDKGVTAGRKLNPGSIYIDKLSSEEYIREFVNCWQGGEEREKSSGKA